MSGAPRRPGGPPAGLPVAPVASEPAPIPGLAALAAPRLSAEDLWPGIAARLAPRQAEAPALGSLPAVPPSRAAAGTPVPSRRTAAADGNRVRQATPRHSRRHRESLWPAALAASLAVAALAGLLLPALLARTPLERTANAAARRLAVPEAAFDPAQRGARFDRLAALPGYGADQRAEAGPVATTDAGSNPPTEVAAIEAAAVEAAIATATPPRSYRTVRSETADWRNEAGAADADAAPQFLRAVFQPSGSRTARKPRRSATPRDPLGIAAGAAERELLQGHLKLLRAAEREVRRALTSERGAAARNASAMSAAAGAAEDGTPSDAQTLRQMLMQLESQQAQLRRLLADARAGPAPADAAPPSLPSPSSRR